MKKAGRSWLWWITIIAVVGAVAAWYFWPNDSGEQRLNTSKAELRNIEVVVTATGRLRPVDFVDVGAQVSGQLETLHVEVGDTVQQGQVLAEIDATVLEARLDGVRAQLRFQQAQKRERQATLDLALINQARQEKLFTDRATSEEAVQSARATARAEAARLDAVQAQIEQTESSLRADEANLNYTRIFAPMDGTVTNIVARRGQTLNAAQTTPTIMTIANLAVMEVQAQVSEADVSRLRDSMPVYFTTLGSRNQRWYSTLDIIEPTPVVENNVVLYNALFTIPNPEGVLLPQMTTQVFFVVDSAENVLSVPASAIRPRGRGQWQVQVIRDGVPVDVPVEIGISDRVHTEIKSGLSAGDEVVIPTQAGMPPGAAMRMMRG